MKLNALSKGQIAKIDTILNTNTENEIVQLIEKGFLPDKDVKIIRKAPFGGPWQLRVGNSNIFIRKDQADNILVQI